MFQSCLVTVPCESLSVITPLGSRHGKNNSRLMFAALGRSQQPAGPREGRVPHGPKDHDSSSQTVRVSIRRTPLPGVKRVEELRRLDRGVLGHVREQEFLVRTDPFFNVPLERKPDIFPSYQARVDRRLRLTHQEQKAIKPVRDELLGLRALRPVYSQGRFDGDGNFSRQDPYSRTWRDLIVAPF